MGLVVLVILGVCCCLYRRQKKQINEYKQLYFLQQSDYKVLNAALFLLLFIGVLHIRELNQKREQVGVENRQSFLAAAISSALESFRLYDENENEYEF